MDEHDHMRTDFWDEHWAGVLGIISPVECYSDLKKMIKNGIPDIDALIQFVLILPC